MIDLATVALQGFAIKGAAKGLKAAEELPLCFVAGTLVATEGGKKPIEEIEIGDKVLSENPETGEVAYKTVEETYINETDELIHVHVNGEIISATPNHPFYVDKLGWTLAKSLRAGDILVLSNGEFVVVEWIQHEILENPVKVYNFKVEDFHTYFVGKSAVLVHNDCPDWLKKKFEEGNKFNKDNRPRYQYNEVEVQGSNKNYRVDSYNPNDAIVSRKYTQLSEVQEKTAIGYINELSYKYPSGATITDSPFNPKVLRGKTMIGSLYLEVPVQNNPVPKSIIDAANNKNITIIDINGKVYN